MSEPQEAWQSSLRRLRHHRRMRGGAWSSCNKGSEGQGEGGERLSSSEAERGKKPTHLARTSLLKVKVPFLSELIK